MSRTAVNMPTLLQIQHGRARSQRYCKFPNCDPISLSTASITTPPLGQCLFRDHATYFHTSVFFTPPIVTFRCPSVPGSPGDPPPGSALRKCASRNRRCVPLDTPMFHPPRMQCFLSPSNFSMMLLPHRAMTIDPFLCHIAISTHLYRSTVRADGN